ncbi:YolD-like family protein [Lachnospiraceae bacterium]|nr:YolD-like family protein [Lachnospiraceae bacterium]
MSRAQRAKQFMPFAALKGFSEALRQKEKVLVRRAELSEEYQEELNRRLMRIKKEDVISLVYFENGEYLQIAGIVSEIDKISRVLKIVNVEIKFDDIYDIGSEMAETGEGWER